MKFKKLFARKKSNRRESRANPFMLESLEPRLLLSATPMTAAVVTTDHLDYAPGETAVITTSNNTMGDGLQFAAGELVRFQVSRTDGMADHIGSTSDVGPAGNEAWYVADGVGGFAAHLGSDVSGDGVADWIAPDNDLTVNSSISTTWFVEEQYRNSSLLVTAAGQESGALATQAFTDVAVNTTTVLTSSTPTTIYGDIVTFTATVTAAAGIDAPTGTVEFWDGSALMGTFTVPDSTGIGTSTWSITVNQYLIEGPHPRLHAVFTGTAGSFNDSTSASITHTVTPKQITASFTVNDKAYDGSTTATGVIVTLTGALAPDNVSVVFSTATFSDANVGGNKTVTLTGATLVGTERLNYSLASSTIMSTGNITKKALTVTLTVDNKVYDGSTAATGVIATLSGVIVPDSVSLIGGTATFDNANAGTGKLVSFTGATLAGAGSANYSLTLPATTTADITAKVITGGFTAANKVYDGSTSAGVLSRTLSGVIGADDVSLTGGTAAFTDANVGTGKTVTLTGATLTGATATNYSLSSVNTSTANIAKANATIVVSGYSSTYDAAAHGATLTSATGVNSEDLSGSVILGGETFTDVPGGTATWTFNGGTNYTDANGSVGIVIAKATAIITGAALNGSGYFGTYNGQAHAGTATVTGVGGANLGTVVSSTTHTNAGVYSDTVTYTDATGNYNNASKVVKSYILKANATLTGAGQNGSGYFGTYDGLAHAATATVTGVGGANLGTAASVTTATNAGVVSHTVTFAGDTNYKAGSKVLKTYILKATATITVTGYNVAFNGAAHTATGTATGVNGEDLSAGLNLIGTTHTAKGVYLNDTVTFTGGTNYKDAIRFVSNRII